MSGIKVYVRNEQEKQKLIKDYLAPDNKYLDALDALKEELIHQGVDLETKEGKKRFIMAVKRLNILFGKDLHTKTP
jgi:hypothetical protein